MRRLRTLLVVSSGAAALVGCTAILGSFDQATVGDANAQDGATDDTAAPPPPDGGGGGDGSSTVDANDGAPPPPTCTLPQVACGTLCVNLDNSPDNCGACGHSCGGGQCTQRHCGPAPV